MRKLLKTVGIMGLSVSLLVGCGSGKGNVVEDNMVEDDMVVDLVETASDRYNDYILSNANEIQEGFKALGNATGDPRFTDDNWKLQVAMAIVQIQVAVEDGLSYTEVPVEYEEAHNTYIESLKLYDSSVSTLAKAIDAMDISQMEESVMLLGQGNKMFELAVMKYKKVGGM